jgi:hypothetical protein
MRMRTQTGSSRIVIVNNRIVKMIESRIVNRRLKSISRKVLLVFAFAFAFVFVNC